MLYLHPLKNKGLLSLRATLQHCNARTMSAVLDLTPAPLVLSVVLHC
jgi:hypothetical protein